MQPDSNRVHPGWSKASRRAAGANSVLAHRAPTFQFPVLLLTHTGNDSLGLHSPSAHLSSSNVQVSYKSLLKCLIMKFKHFPIKK